MTQENAEEAEPELDPEMEALAVRLMQQFASEGGEDDSEMKVPVRRNNVTVNNWSRTSLRPPRAVETKTQTQAYLDFYRMDEDELKAFQRKAEAAGLFPNTPRWGEHDEASFNVWKAMVDRSANFYAAGVTVTPTEAMERAVLAGAAQADATPVELPNAVELRQVFKKASEQLRGRGLSDSELTGMTSAYLSTLRDAHAAALAAEGQGVELEAPMSQTAFASNYMDENYGDEVEATEFAAAGDVFFQMIRESNRG